jgi:hypothetical protein
VLPPAWERKLKSGALAFGKALVEERIRELEAQLDALRADVQAMSEMLARGPALLEHNLCQPVLDQLRKLQLRTLRILEDAECEQDPAIALAAIAHRLFLRRPASRGRPIRSSPARTTAAQSAGKRPYRRPAIHPSDTP